MVVGMLFSASFRTFYFTWGLVAGLSVTSFAVNADPSKDYEQALSTYNSENVDEAYIQLKNIMSAYPEHLPSKVLMADVLLRKGYVLDAIDEYEEALQLGADFNRVIENLLQAYLLAGQHQRVIDCECRGVNQKTEPYVQLLKASAFDYSGNTDAARSRYQQAYSLAPRSTRVLTSYANFLMSHNEAERAKEFIDAALALESNNPRVMHAYSLWLSRDGQVQLALEWLERAYALQRDDPVIQRTKAFLLIKLRRFDESIDLINTILAENQNDVLVRLTKARLLFITNQEEEAQNILSDLSGELSTYVVDDVTSRSKLNLLKGLTSYLSGNYTDSTVQIEQYLTLAGEDDNAIQMLAQLYELSRQPRKVKVLLESKITLVKQDAELVKSLCRAYAALNRHFLCDDLLVQLTPDIRNVDSLKLFEVDLLRQQGKVNSAIALFNETFKAPFSLAQQLLLTRLRLLSGDTQKALALIDDLIQRYSDNADLKLLKAEVLLNSENLTGAQRLLAEIKQSSPNNIQYRKLNAQALTANNELEAATEELEALINELPYRQDLVIQLARLLGKRSLFDDAISLLNKYKNEFDSDYQLDEALVNLYVQKQQNEDALTIINTLNKSSFSNPEYIFKKAAILINLGRNEEAQREILKLENLIAMSPQNVSALLGLRKQLEDHSGALAYLERIAAEQPLTKPQQLEKARLLALNGQSEIALTELNRLLNSDEKNIAALFLAGEVHSQVGQNELAFQRFKQGFEASQYNRMFAGKLFDIASLGTNPAKFENSLRAAMSTTLDPAMEGLLGLFFYGQGRVAEALPLLQQYEESNQTYRRESVLLALTRMLQQDSPSLAVEYAKKAFETNNKSAEVAAEYGWSLALYGDYDGALARLREANIMDTANPKITFQLAVVLRKLGRCEDAERWLRDIGQGTDGSELSEQFGDVSAILTGRECRSL